MRVAVIGAGASGLISAKVLSEEGINYDVYERNNEIGGTWIYTENTTDKYGLPVSSSMYRDLRTNLPKEVMEFTGHHYDIEDKSYLTSSEVLTYLKSFYKKSQLQRNIKFEHLVQKVSRTDKGWDLTSKDLNSGAEVTVFYDAIFVCNGHYSLPRYPNIEGAETFKGVSIHSHYYKVPDIFSDKTVLVIGMGPSAQDIVFNISPTSTLIYLSHHGPESVKKLFPENVIHKPDVKMISGRTIFFVDETSVEVEAILFCTGYKYSFPFLDESCEIKVSNNYVTPLYKHVFSIAHPTMVFIGIPFKTFIFPLLELQARFAVNVIAGKAKLVSKKEMLEDMKNWENLQISRGYSQHQFHVIIDNIYEYVRELENLGGVSPCQEARVAVNVLLDNAKLFLKKEMLEDMTTWENLQRSRGYSQHQFHMIGDNVYEYIRELEKLGGVAICPEVLFKIYSRCSLSRKNDLVKYRDEIFKILDSKNFILL